MLHWCGNSSSGGAAAPCSFSILFPVSGKHGMEEDVDGGSASSSVDCTLTLGTPYTRQLSSSSSSSRMQRSTTASTMCWDILPQQGKQSLPPNVTGGTHAGGGGNCGGNVNGDPLISRRCANCDTTSTPLWRNGPRGPKSLCNACGIRYKKEERRAAASSTAATATGEGIGYSYPYGNTQPAWGCYVPAETLVKSSVSGYAGGEVEEQRDLYLPWRLNVVPTQYR